MPQKSHRTAALHNLGCKVNAYETEAMQQQLEAAGYKIVPFAPGADVYVINTCSVTNIADRKSRQMLHRARKLNPDAVVVAVGCYVQTAREKTGLDVKADILLGNNRKKELVSALEEYFAESEERGSAQGGTGRIPEEGCFSDIQRKTGRERLTDLSKTAEYETLHLSSTKEHTRAFVKVQDGCNQFCSYCIIPYARGRIRSRDSQDVVRELCELASHGIREAVLTGIHLSSYGRDLPEEGENLLSLIRKASEIEGIERIRLGSLEPGIVTEDFASELSGISKICPHFHLSLQSGCDSVLKRMNRRYDTAEYEARCEILRKYFSSPALTTDVIVGFPGETSQEFACTRGFLERISFYETHIFKYSRREGTRAASMPDQIDEEIKTERSSCLIRLGERKKAEYIREMEHVPCEVLFEEPVELSDGKTYYTGYTREYIQVAIPASEDFSNRILRGSYALEPGKELPIFTPY